jgi:hypothetical protein
MGRALRCISAVIEAGFWPRSGRPWYHRAVANEDGLRGKVGLSGRCEPARRTGIAPAPGRLVTATRAG